MLWWCAAFDGHAWIYIIDIICTNGIRAVHLLHIHGLLHNHPHPGLPLPGGGATPCCQSCIRKPSRICHQLIFVSQYSSTTHNQQQHIIITITIVINPIQLIYFISIFPFTISLLSRINPFQIKDHPVFVEISILSWRNYQKSNRRLGRKENK